jgi:hypothetical protein
MSSFTNRKHNNNEVYLENIVKKLENENIQNSEKIKNYEYIEKFIIEALNYNGTFEMKIKKGDNRIINNNICIKIIKFIKRDLKLSKDKKLDEKLLIVLINISNCADNVSFVSNVTDETFLNHIFKKIDNHLENRSFIVLDEFIAFLGLINIELKPGLQEKSILKIINVFLKFNTKEHTNYYYFLHKVFVALINSSSIPVCMNKIYENGNDIISKIKNILEKNEFILMVTYKDRINEIYKLMIQTFCNFLALKPDFVKIMKQQNVDKIVSVESIKILMPDHCEFIINSLNGELPE